MIGTGACYLMIYDIAGAWHGQRDEKWNTPHIENNQNMTKILTQQPFIQTSTARNWSGLSPKRKRGCRHYSCSLQLLNRIIHNR